MVKPSTDFPRKPRSNSLIPEEAATRVQRSDLTRLEVLHELLALLNDPTAGAPPIAGHVDRFPCLRARIVRRFVVRFPNRDVGSLAEQIAALGNRELERILLGVLEELTELRAELESLA